MIFVIDDNEIMAECIARAARKAGKEVIVFHNALEAMDALSHDLPEMIFLDILLDGPDGFSFLNEMVSYDDTARIPIVVVSALDLNKMDLSIYGVVGVLNKDTMKPQEITEYVQKFAK